MVDIQSLSLLVPIILLIVLKVSDVARGIDLKERFGEKGWTVKFGDGPHVDGHFLGLHLVNYYTLAALFMAVSDLYTGNFLLTLAFLQPVPEVSFYLSTISLILWAIFPLAEVRYSEDLRVEGPIPKSFLYHVISVTLFALVIRLAQPLRAAKPDAVGIDFFTEMIGQFASSPLLLAFELLLMPISFFLVVGGGFIFVNQLHYELEETLADKASSERDDETEFDEEPSREAEGI